MSAPEMVFSVGAIKHGTGFERTAHFIGTFPTLDAAREHARLAQLGARVLEILARHPDIGQWSPHLLRAATADERMVTQALASSLGAAWIEARSLGLLPEGEAKP